MNRLLTACAAAVLGTTAAFAESPIGGIFNHLGVGAGVGTTGIELELATPITNWVSMRAGVAIMPDIKFHTDADVDYTISSSTQTSEINLDLGLGRTQGKVIFNFYPFQLKNSLFIAAGAYFGGNHLIKIKGHSDELANAGMTGQIQVGDYLIPVDQNGNVDGALKINGFRPYLGIGYGRAIPRRLINFNIELGVQFQGEPQVYTSTGKVDVNYGDIDNSFSDIIKYLKVYPTLTFRICGKIF